MPWGMRLNVPLHPKANCGKERATSLYSEGHSDQRRQTVGREDVNPIGDLENRPLCEAESPCIAGTTGKKFGEIVVFWYKIGNHVRT